MDGWMTMAQGGRDNIGGKEAFIHALFALPL